MRMTSEELSPREWAEYNNQKEMWELGAAHAKEMKQLEIEVMKLEAKWSSWMKIPIKIILLPIYLVFGIAFCIAVARKSELPPEYWRFLN